MIEDEIEQDDEEQYDIECRCIQLVNGEQFVAGIHIDDLAFTSKRIIKLYNPVKLLKCTQNIDGRVTESYMMLRWNELSFQDEFEIKTDPIFTIYELQDKFEQKYFEALHKIYIDDLKSVLQRDDLDEDERAEIHERLVEATDGEEEIQDEKVGFGNSEMNRVLH